MLSGVHIVKIKNCSLNRYFFCSATDFRRLSQINRFWLKPEEFFIRFRRAPFDYAQDNSPFLLNIRNHKIDIIASQILKLRISKPRIPHPKPHHSSFIIKKKPPENLPMAVTKNKCIKKYILQINFARISSRHSSGLLFLTFWKRLQQNMKHL